MMFLRQSTARTLLIGPVLDSNGAAVTNETVSSIKITKNGTVGALNGSATLTHNHSGMYLLAMTTSDVDTLGIGQLSLTNGTNAMAPVSFNVVPALTYDALIAGSDYLRVKDHDGNQLLPAASYTAPLNATETAEAVWDAQALDWIGAGTMGHVINDIGEKVPEILQDTEVLQTDWADDGRLDLLLDIAASYAVPEASEIADAVWDEEWAGHTTPNTYGNDFVTAANNAALAAGYGNLLATDWNDGGRLDLILDQTAADAATAATLEIPTPEDVANAVWLEDIGGHDIGNTFGNELLNVASNVWEQLLVNHTSNNTFGGAVGAIRTIVTATADTVDDISSRIPEILMGGWMPVHVMAMGTQVIIDETLAPSAIEALQAGLSSPSASEIADAVWDELVADHVIEASFGDFIQNDISGGSVDADAIAAAVWNEPVLEYDDIFAFGGYVRAIAGQAATQTASAVWNAAVDDHIEIGSFGEFVQNRLGVSTGAIDATLTVHTQMLMNLPPADVIADAVWDELGADHIIAGTFGLFLNQLQTDWSDGGRLDTLLDGIYDAAVEVGGPGAIAHAVTVKTRNGTPIPGVGVWVSTDSAGQNVIAGTLVTDAFGVVTFHLDPGTYYLWRQRAGYTFPNPREIAVA